MKITYLGTAAAEGVPALFCKCSTCQSAGYLKGKNIRTRSQTLINDDLLLDYPPDTYLHVLNYGLDLDKIDDILITHSHGDHLFPHDLISRSDYYSPVRNSKTLNIYGNDTVIEVIKQSESPNEVEMFLKTATLNPLQPFVKTSIGNYTVYPLKANHKNDENSFIYIIIDKEGKTILYAHDTGYFPEETWKFLKENNFKLNFVSLDCTSVFLECENGHMGINCCNKVKQRLLDENIADDKTYFCIHHFSHNGKFLDHEEMINKAKDMYMDVSFDGKEINI